MGEIRVTLEQMVQAGTDLENASSATGQALGTFLRATGSASPEVLGGSEVTAAVDLLRSRLRAHLQAQSETLGRLGQIVSESAQAYATTDQQNAQTLDSTAGS